MSVRSIGPYGKKANMPGKKYIVELTIEERKQLEASICKGKVAGHKIRHAQMLLKADAGEHGPA